VCGAAVGVRKICVCAELFRFRLSGGWVVGHCARSDEMASTSRVENRIGGDCAAKSHCTHSAWRSELSCVWRSGRRAQDLCVCGIISVSSERWVGGGPLRAQRRNGEHLQSRKSNRSRLRGEIALRTPGVAWRVEVCVVQWLSHARCVCLSVCLSVCVELFRFCLGGGWVVGTARAATQWRPPAESKIESVATAQLNRTAHTRRGVAS
jgi:hypothetical protein